MSTQRRLTFRTAAALVACLGAGCASTPRAGDEQARQLKAMQDRQELLERKIEQLENRLAVLSHPPAPAVARAPVAAEPSGRGNYALPGHLTTVRLSPERRSPTRLSTDVQLREPPPEVMQQLMTNVEVEEDGAEPVVGAGAPGIEAAMQALRTGDVENGVRQLEQFADRNPRHPDAPVALFTAGHAMQNYGEPMLAVLFYQRVADDYPLAVQAPEAMLRMAACQLKMKKAAAARELLARLIQRYPASPITRTAESELRELERQAATAQAATDEKSKSN